MSDGPSYESLRRMAQMLPSMTAGVQSKKIGGGGVRLVPTATCDICGKAHRHVTTGRNAPLPVVATCDACLNELKDNTCLKSPSNHFAFVKSPKLPTGQVIHVSNEEMSRVQMRLRHDAHLNDIRAILTAQGCLNDKGEVVSWHEDTWQLLIDAGHDALELKECKCCKV